jgi:hypothetical protein
VLINPAIRRLAAIGPVLCVFFILQPSAAPAADGTTTINAFVPNGYQIAAQVRADFNRDSKPDLALVLWESRESEKDRLLIILLQQGDGSYRLAAKTAKLLPGAAVGCGIANPYCVPDLKNKGRLLTVAWRSGAGMAGSTQEFEFRYERGDFYLVGSGVSDWSPEGCLNDGAIKLAAHEKCVSHGVSTDFANGRQIEIWSIQHEVSHRERVVRASRPMPKLSLRRLVDMAAE